jgi:hypothetical protein
MISGLRWSKGMNTVKAIVISIDLTGRRVLNGIDPNEVSS